MASAPSVANPSPSCRQVTLPPTKASAFAFASVCNAPTLQRFYVPTRDKPPPSPQDPLTIFFDDNAAEKEIIAPLLAPGAAAAACERIVAVDPVLALEGDEYFVAILRGMGVLE